MEYQEVNNYLALQAVTYANQAALPAVASPGQLAIILDDGTGKAALYIWDAGTSSWILSTGGALEVLDWQDSVLSGSFNDPTAIPPPSVGDRYIVAAGGVGAWAGHDDDIAEYEAGVWDFTTPNEGFACAVEDINKVWVYNGSAWVTLAIYANMIEGPVGATDNAIVRYDGTTGTLAQNSSVLIDDNGNIELSGTSADIASSDQTGATSSINVLVASGDVTGGGATGLSGDIDIETGATVDGNSGDINITIGAPTGTGTAGDINLAASNINTTLYNSLFKISTANAITSDSDILEIFNASEKVFDVAIDVTGLSAAYANLWGSATRPNAIYTARANAVTNISGFAADDSAGKGARLLYFNGACFFDSDYDFTIKTANDLQKYLSLGTGNESGANNSGYIEIRSGNSGADSGKISIITGSGTDDSGNIELTIGSSGVNPGNVVITLGDAANVSKLTILDNSPLEVASITSDGHLNLLGSYFRNVTPVTATPYTADLEDDVILVNIAGLSTVNLPTAAGITGKIYHIKRLSPPGVNTVTVQPNGGETIDGAAPVLLAVQYQSISIVSNGTNWYLL